MKSIYIPKKIISALSVTALIPSLAFAEFNLYQGGLTFKDIIKEFINIINLLNPILFSLTFVAFFWGLSKFILNSNKPEEIKNGRNYMIWAVAVLFVLVTFRTIISLVSKDVVGGSGSTNPGSILLPTNVLSPSVTTSEEFRI